ncbi:hypothetical protein [Streptomyces sp. DH37]|uniref:hypothetical protein n=1 Tax=Streptomyces sp. DH37 TaxID=3040122 RepID=UPI002441785F|nr:hypothetical protein [Streptomyces sp. DH37]MDG9701502.1 hypothetical protein [Streptomyces sp. DH37]
MTSPTPDPASAVLLDAVASLRSGAPLDVELLRGPLAELLQDAAAGDGDGVVNPYARAVAAAVLGHPA